METFCEEGEIHHLHSTFGTQQSSCEDQLSTARDCPFHIEDSAEPPHAVKSKRYRFSVDKQRQDIDSFISEFNQARMSLVRNFVPMQTSEMKRKGGKCQVKEDDIESDGDSLSEAPKPDSILDMFKHSFSKIEDRIKRDTAKSQVKKEVGEKRSKNIRTARVVITQKAELTDGYLKINFATCRALGRAAPLLTWKQGIEIANEKFARPVEKRARRVQFATIIIREITKCTKLCVASRSLGQKVFQNFVEEIRSMPSGLPVAMEGLPNTGNSDFANAVLNLLFYIKPLNDFMKAQNQTGKNLGTAFEKFCKAYQTSVPVTDILSSIWTYLPEFVKGKSACAHNFLVRFLTRLDKDMPCSPETQGVPETPVMAKVAAYQKGKCKDLHSLFSCLLENVFTCSNCFGYWQTQSYSRSIDLPIMDKAAVSEKGVTYFGPRDFFNEQISRMSRLSGPNDMKTYTSAFRAWNGQRTEEELPIVEQDASLDLCFQYMLRASLMSAENTFECQHCGKSTQHFKQSFLRHIGKVLVIHFQRFNDILGHKLDTFVDCPKELDMQKYCQAGGKYELKGVINHCGSPTAGHYSAYVKVRGQWFLFDDDVVSPVDPETDLFQAAYVVAYVRQ